MKNIQLITTIIAAVALIVSVISPVLIWYGAFRYFLGGFERWQKDSEKWRESIDKWMARIEADLRTALDRSPIVLIQNMDNELARLRTWRDSKADPLLNEVEQIRRHVERMEKDFRGMSRRRQDKNDDIDG
jgi:hypothetical protein